MGDGQHDHDPMPTLAIPITDMIVVLIGEFARLLVTDRSVTGPTFTIARRVAWPIAAQRHERSVGFSVANGMIGYAAPFADMVRAIQNRWPYFSGPIHDHPRQ